VIALLFAAGHSLGGLKQWSPMGENDVLKAMRETRFATMGVSRSYLDFYMGFGQSLAVLELMVAVLLWQLARTVQVDAAAVRPMIATIALATLINGAIAWRFIFPLPAVFSLVLFASLAVAFFAAR
jgi:hypothetical protein